MNMKIIELLRCFGRIQAGPKRQGLAVADGVDHSQALTATGHPAGQPTT